MAFTIKVDIGKDARKVIAKERLFETKDRKRLVSQDHKDAGFLFCTEGVEILEEDAIRFGLIKVTREVVPHLEPLQGEKRESSDPSSPNVPDVSEILAAEKALQERLEAEEEDRKRKLQKEREQEAEEKERKPQTKELNPETK